MRLFIGNKNYSSWSMRPWVLMRGLGISFEETMLYFDSFEPDSEFKQAILKVNPTGRVPTLLINDIAVWDSLTIAETLAENFPDAGVWPTAGDDRALARSLCAEMHSSFSCLRELCPMNIEATFPEVGTRLLQTEAGLAKDIAALEALLLPPLNNSEGDFLFGDFCAADAFYAPVASRLKTYQLPTSPELAAYFDRLIKHPAVRDWISDALVEHRFVPFDEPYRDSH